MTCVMKHIYKYGNCYSIRKSINKKVYSFGNYKSLEMAIEMRDYFESKGWENCLKERLDYTEPPKNYVSLKRGVFYPIKTIKGQIVYGMVCHTLEECLEEVQLLNKVDWDLDALCEGIDETIDGEIIFLNKKMG